MKTVTIGDLHGLDVWKRVKKNVKNYDKIIFIGDYVDSFNLSDSAISRNLIEIIEFKKNNIDKVELLIGNHDLMYMFTRLHGFATGFRSGMAPVLNQIFYENKDLFKVAYQYNEYIWSHAGITNDWVMEYTDVIHNELWGNLPWGERLTAMLQTRKGVDILNTVSRLRGGLDFAAGPLWCHETELIANAISGFKQIVGHTRGNNIRIYDNCVICDCLENNFESCTEPQFFELEIPE